MLASTLLLTLNCIEQLRFYCTEITRRFLSWYCPLSFRELAAQLTRCDVGEIQTTKSQIVFACKIWRNVQFSPFAKNGAGHGTISFSIQHENFRTLVPQFLSSFLSFEAMKYRWSQPLMPIFLVTTKTEDENKATFYYVQNIVSSLVLLNDKVSTTYLL